MGDRNLRRWLVPGLAVAAIALPLLVGGCFEDFSEEWSWLRDCGDCYACYDEDGDPGYLQRPLPEGLPPLPQEGQGQEPGSGYARPPEEPAHGLPGATAQEPADEPSDPPDVPHRPRIPDGVLQPRPDAHLRPPTQSPKPSY